jgi:hypothetical protein
VVSYPIFVHYTEKKYCASVQMPFVPLGGTGNGDVCYTGLLCACNSSGLIDLSGSSGTLEHFLFARPSTLVHLTRVSSSGVPGHLTYTIVASTITVSSTSSAEQATVNYIITSKS